MDRLPAWRWWLAAIGAAFGYLVGVVLAVTLSSGGRAEASTLITSPRGAGAVRPALPNLRELATSSVLAGNVRSTLRLNASEEDVRRRLHASIRPQSEVVVIRARASDGDHARQLAQEAAVVFTQLVDARFGKLTPPLHATLFDAAHALSPSRPILRDSLVGAALGLVAGVSVAIVLSRRTVPATGIPPGDMAGRERLLERRVELVAARERALARRAGELAAKEQELTRTRKPSAAEPPSDAERPVPIPEPAVEAVAPAPPPSLPPLLAAPLPLNVQQLERLVESRVEGAPSDVVDNWRTYLFYLREHAAADGSLPADFSSLVDDVFADLKASTQLSQ